MQKRKETMVPLVAWVARPGHESTQIHRPGGWAEVCGEPMTDHRAVTVRLQGIRARRTGRSGPLDLLDLIAGCPARSSPESRWTGRFLHKLARKRGPFDGS
jgi:hypothetical protein